ncbi:HD domain-containing protein [Candidatus Woesearchaeota archaeon]|nr:HD domain-containing protein [Candidatus Woesearchaeota archaeon]
MNIPGEEQCLQMLKDNKTPSNVIEHSKTVCEFALVLANKLEQKGIEINKDMVIAASLLHDIQRVEDNHLIEGANLLNKLGFPEIATIIRKHGLSHINQEEHKPKTIEEKIVFYADKRVKGNQVVSLRERFDDLKIRYNRDDKKEFEFTKKIEEELNKKSQ